MYKYEIIVWWSDADEAYIADVPKLPGCTAHGETYHEAIEQIQTAMEGWIEVQKERGYEIPEPQGRSVYA